MFIKFYAFRQYVALTLATFLLLSPFTFYGDNLVACLNPLGNVVHIEPLHNPHIVPSDSESSCNHENEEHALSFQCDHEHDLCSDIPVSTKVLLQRNTCLSLIKQYSQLSLFTRCNNEAEYNLQYLSKFSERKQSCSSFTEIIRSVILLC